MFWDLQAYVPWVLFVMRVFTAVGIFLHGLPKLTHPQFGLLGQRGFAGFLAQIGFPAPMLTQFLAVLIEVVGGVFLALGLFTQLATGLLFLEMLVASYVSKVKLKQPYLCVDSKGYEIDLFYAIVSLVLFVTGPGALALDRLLG
jgi:putative oxidoreductase